MMGRPDRYATMTAAVLRRLLLPFHASSDRLGPPDRDKTVSLIERALARRARRLALKRRLGRSAALAAAALVLVATGWLISRHDLPAPSDALAPHRPSRAFTVLKDDPGDLARVGNAVGNLRLPGSAVVAGGGQPPVGLTQGMMLDEGTGLLAPSDSEVRIGTADGTLLTLENAGALVVGEQSEHRHFSLKRGAVRARVSKLKTGERFIIDTDDAQVEVHGTVFRVSMVGSDAACGKGVRTRVSVEEGVVSVRSGGSEEFVPAGGSWPAGCGDHPKPAALARAVSPGAALGLAVPARGAVPGALGEVAARGGAGTIAAAGGPYLAGGRSTRGSDRTSTAGAAAAPAGSALAAQNDLFAAAIRAKRQGRTDDSVRLFSQLIGAHPEGPLTEGAMAQRMRLLARQDGVVAAHAASQYLVQFPGGFARAEARRLAAALPP